MPHLGDYLNWQRLYYRVVHILSVETSVGFQFLFLLSEIFKDIDSARNGFSVEI